MKIKAFQEGGVAPAEAPVAEQAPAAAEDQMMQQLVQVAQDIISQLGPEGAAMLAQVIMQMLEEGASQPVDAAPQEQQFMRCGGKIQKKSRKAIRK